MPATELPVSGLLPVRAFLLGRRVRLLVAVTMIHTAALTALSWTAGTGLTGPGLAGVAVHVAVSMAAALPVRWQFAGDPVARQQRAVRAMSVSFAVLAAYSVVDALRDAAARPVPGESWAGATLALLVAVMIAALGLWERREGAKLNAEERALVAPSVVVIVDAVLVVAATTDLLAGTTSGGPAVAAVVAVLATREAVRAASLVESRPRR